MNELLGVTCIPREDVPAVAPLVDFLIIYVCVGLGQEGQEAFRNAKLLSRRLGVLGPAELHKYKSAPESKSSRTRVTTEGMGIRLVPIERTKVSSTSTKITRCLM